MKKITAVLLSIILLYVSLLPLSATAAEEKREYLSDGSYFVEVVADAAENENFPGILARLLNFLRSLVDFFKGQKTVTKTKYLNYYSSDGELLWSAMLKGEFVCSKKLVICSSSDFNIDIYDSDWSLLSFSCRENENTATADFTVLQTKLLVPLKTVEKTLSLTCDINGNVK